MLKRDTLNPKRYEYLDEEESKLYSRAKVGDIGQMMGCSVIMDLLEKLAKEVRSGLQ